VSFIIIVDSRGVIISLHYLEKLLTTLCRPKWNIFFCCKIPHGLTDDVPVFRTAHKINILCLILKNIVRCLWSLQLNSMSFIIIILV